MPGKARKKMRELPIDPDERKAELNRRRVATWREKQGLEKLRASRHVQTRLLAAEPDFDKIADEIITCLGPDKTKRLIGALREVCK